MDFVLLQQQTSIAVSELISVTCLQHVRLLHSAQFALLHALGDVTIRLTFCAAPPLPALGTCQACHGLLSTLTSPAVVGYLEATRTLEFRSGLCYMS